ncbi:hypothetical protein U879_09970 [Defluviimonas sp. 20V17]|uniref:Membrane fusion protein, multidrug efflux system n=1 Tax=Allgaiera indica TaxID=765699 RepID=A0AAN4UPI6_9RHOB|nr:efflux RND transporter periplasmic adaptor subunit [Allgaiera indica]KDB03876.1 hypothetical protein U879_09970 [Defluviimonas sp. 20V17]GHE00096.1 RND transporter [Allgaiera indica]SDW37283.1 membrane fusion protein, multidrug efflux system [Allgaiera indica]
MLLTRRHAALCGRAAVVFLCAASPVLAQQRPGGPGHPVGPTKVGVVTLARSDVPYRVTLPGRAVAYEQVDIRPRVEGVVQAIPYGPGHRVQKGEVLFRIDGDDYKAQAAAAQAAVAQAQASLANAQATLNRYKALENKGITAEQVSTAQVAVVQAKASLLSAQASLQTAQLNLDRTVVRSPITGVAGVATVSVGALVTANQTTALTTVTRLDPIYVDVEESIRRINEVRDAIAAGRLKAGDKLEASLEFDSGQVFKGKGTLVSPGATVSASTGTTTFRFQFDNPDRRILPGMFVRVNVTLGSVRAILVPQGPTTRASTGALTAFIARDGTAHQVTLTTSGTYHNAWIVTGGVKPGDELIVDGLSRLRAGAKIAPTPVAITPDGVVTDKARPAATGAAGNGVAGKGVAGKGVAATAPKEAPAKAGN